MRSWLESGDEIMCWLVVKYLILDKHFYWLEVKLFSYHFPTLSKSRLVVVAKKVGRWRWDHGSFSGGRSCRHLTHPASTYTPCNACNHKIYMKKTPLLLLLAKGSGEIIQLILWPCVGLAWWYPSWLSVLGQLSKPVPATSISNEQRIKLKLFLSRKGWGDFERFKS